jgi:hypothetical protein
MKSSGRNLDELTAPMYHPPLKLHLLVMVGLYFAGAMLAIISYFDPHGNEYIKKRKSEDDYLRQMRRRRIHRISPGRKL